MEKAKKTSSTVLGRPDRRLLRVSDVMERLGCSRATVHRRMADGTLPAVRIGRLVRFRPETVEALLEVAEHGVPALVGGH
jgi:excisionase family DNA binding protein